MISSEPFALSLYRILNSKWVLNFSKLNFIDANKNIKLYKK